MYTKPVDVQNPHSFQHKKFGGHTVTYDPMQWHEFYDSREKLESQVPIYIAGSSGHVFLCLHGAGHSAQSFAAFAKYMKVESTVVAFDFRGHGENFCEDESNLNVDTLIDDTINVFKQICQKFRDQSIILVGHSMGGSIATKTAAKILKDHAHDDIHKQLQGLIVIDVVEGSAMDALPFMENIVMSRPSEFKSLASVVQYGIKSGQVKDHESAKVSMPDQVIPKVDEATGITKYVWRTDLMATKPYWESWFTGLTDCFLNVRLPKQLLLAGSDRMDKDLTIAQMQGKFKMVVVENVGHAI